MAPWTCLSNCLEWKARTSLCARLERSLARLVLNGEPVVKQKGIFQLRSNTGSVLAVKFKSRFLDPIPNLEVGGMTIQAVPALQWYQYIWMGLPIVLLFMGGAVGGSAED